jgi:KipI family sensor histidine kinase inhibitor
VASIFRMRSMRLSDVAGHDFWHIRAPVASLFVRMLRYGGSGLLVELPSSARVAVAYRALRAAMDRAALPGVVELVPAARTVLVTVADGASVPVDRVRAVLDELAPDATPQDTGGAAGREVVIPVRYDGADLALVAGTASLSVPEVVELHSSARYTVAFCGFAPGFAYLTGLPEPLRQARRDTPRTRVPAGSVAVAGEFSAVYPGSSPGGWRLLGCTEEVMFDPSADPPSRLAPGDRVRFEPLRS